MSRSAQNKAEKAVIDAKVAKVRECVHNVSNNDIVLALHNFDMDEDRTIAAFMDGGIENALGTWEKRGTVTNKKKNRGGGVQTTTVDSSSTTTSTTTETPRLAGATAPAGGSARARKQSQQQQVAATTKDETVKNTKKTTIENGTGTNFNRLPVDARRAECERLQREHDEKAVQARAILDAAAAHKADAFATLAAALAARERQFNIYLDAARHKLDSRATIRTSKAPSVDELARLAADSAALDSLLAQTHTIHVTAALKAIDKLGSSFLPAAHAIDGHPLASAAALSNGAVAPPPPTAANVKPNGTVVTPPQPTPTPLQNLEPAPTPAHADFSTIIAPPHKQNGAAAVAPPSAATAPPPPSIAAATIIPANGKPAAAAAKPLVDGDIKHSVSQSSLVSSVGDDSGLGQVSYANQDKHATPTAESGFLQSDGLSAETIEKLNARIQQQFAAMNINTDMITGNGIEGASIPAPRRRNAPGGGHRQVKNGNAATAAGGNKQQQQSTKAVKSGR